MQLIKKIVGFSLSAFCCVCLNAQPMDLLQSERSTLTQEQEELSENFIDENGRIYWNKKSPVYLFVSANPDGKDVKKLKSEKNPTHSNPIYLDTEGVNYIRTRWAVDENGNKILPEQEVLMEIYADGIAPSTSITMDAPRFYKNGKTYYGKGLTIELSSKDQMSGLNETSYKMDDAEYQSYSKALSLSAEGDHSISYYASDKVGNTEKTKEKSFILDMSAPKTSLLVDGSSVGNILSPKTKIKLSAEDELSGVKTIYYMVDGGAKSRYVGALYLNDLKEGDHSITYYAVDQVKNEESETTYEFFLDKTPTEVSVDFNSDQYENGSTLYLSERSSIAIKGSDNKAGVQDIFYSIGGKPFEKYQSPIASTGLDGRQLLKVYGDDKVANGKNLESFGTYGKNVRFTVDTEGPSIAHSFIGKTFNNRDTVFVTSDTDLMLKATDLVSGVKKLGYMVNGGSEIGYTEKLKFDKEGVYSVSIASADNVNNTSKKDIYFVVDNTAPVVKTVFGSNNIGMIDLDEEGRLDVYSKGLHIYLAATDNVIETQDIYFTLDKGPKTKYRNPIVLNEKGIRTITVTSIDKLGNQNKTPTEIRLFIK